MPITADTIQYGPWDGGVRYDRPVEDLAPSEMGDMQNVRIGSAGEARRRNGSASYQSAAAIASTPTVTMAAEFKPNSSTTYVVIVCGAAIYKYSSGWSAITGAVTVTAGDDNTFEWVNANGTLVATNGVDTDAWKWTGTGDATVLDDDARFTKGKHIAWFDQRLWIGNVNGATNQLWYSDTLDIETWGATSFYNFGGEILALVPAQNALVVHTTDGIYTLIPTGNATVPYQRQVRTQQGAADGRSTVALPGDIELFVRPDGIYRWEGGAEIVKISTQLDGDYWPSLNSARFSKTFAVYYPKNNEVWFALPYGAAQSAMNHVMVYNTTYDRWHGPYTGWTRACGALIDGKPHLGDLDGILWDSDTGNNDGVSAIDAWFTTAAPAPYGGSVRTRWLYARNYFDGQGDYSVTVTQDAGGLVGTTRSLSIRGNSFTLGTDYLGIGVLGSIRMLFRDTDLTGYDPHSSLKYSMNALNQTFTFRHVHLQHRPTGRVRKPAETE